MDVMIGIDPNKGSHTAMMLDRRQRELRHVTEAERLLSHADAQTLDPIAGCAEAAAAEVLVPVAARPDLGPVDEERSERCPLGRRGRLASPVAGAGATG